MWQQLVGCAGCSAICGVILGKVEGSRGKNLVLLFSKERLYQSVLGMAAKGMVG